MEFNENDDTEHVRYSFRAYVIAGYAIVAAATAISIIAIVATVFNIYFSAYAIDVAKSTARLAAGVIASEYAYSSSLEGIDYEGLVRALNLDESEGLMVVDAKGNGVFATTDLEDLDDMDKLDVVSSAIKVNADKVSPDDVSEHDSTNLTPSYDPAYGYVEKIGEVRLWSEANPPFRSNADDEFQGNAYRALIVAGLMATLIAFFFGLFLARIITAPIKEISRTAKELSRGNLSARTGITGDNEIAKLGEAFDTMAESFERDRNHEKRLTSDVAHELRTPLMAIQATVEAMIDGVYDRNDEYLQMVDDEVKRLSRMVDALLRLSRLENRSKPPNLEPNDLSQLAMQEVATHEALIGEMGLHSEFYSSGDVWAICDKDMIEQVLVNLMSNAIRYTPSGGRIYVSVRRNDKWAELVVADTGIGLDPEEEKMVFERFWRAGSDRGRKSGGLGIGLSVVRELVAQNSGEISVKGKKNVGTTFTVKLPACDHPNN